MPSPRVGAQATVSLQEQLAAQYKLVKMGSDTSGYSVVEPGTLLAIQKGGILGVPYSDQSILSTKYESGTVHTPSTLLSKGIGFGMKKFGKEQTTKLFPKGDKVYPTKIDVNLDKDTVAMGIVACECQDLTFIPRPATRTVMRSERCAQGRVLKLSGAEVLKQARPIPARFQTNRGPEQSKNHSHD